MACYATSMAARMRGGTTRCLVPNVAVTSIPNARGKRSVVRVAHCIIEGVHDVTSNRLSSGGGMRISLRDNLWRIESLM